MAIDQQAIDSPKDWVVEHVRSYIETNGEDGHIWRAVPTLILATLGRRSGQPRRLALIYEQDGDRSVVIVSKGGSDRHQAWHLNLRDHPEVQVQVLGNRFRANARTATLEEHRKLWPPMAEILPDYDAYHAETDRPIPLVILEYA